MAQCVLHALKCLACRAPVLLAHAEVTKSMIFFNGSKIKEPHGTVSQPLAHDADPVAAAAVPAAAAAAGAPTEKAETRPRSSASHHCGDASTSGEDLVIAGLGRRLSASLGTTD